ncbi:hypothetical protein C5167_039934 [Papaver somniferum]|uniref:Uncharacterized protein n=1 Tax=Papaver somniferum TaxID=3469 RepID=A0A4Y7IGZ4_PAPSO|nr:hypothetical protein C5167_039934 [Papaver somniferum]
MNNLILHRHHHQQLVLSKEKISSAKKSSQHDTDDSGSEIDDVGKRNSKTKPHVMSAKTHRSRHVDEDGKTPLYLAADLMRCICGTVQNVEKV